MADKLEWLNRHFVLINHLLLEDVVQKEQYKIRPDLAEFFIDENNVENLVWKFADAERYKCAVELMAYMSHRRVAVWWLYNCILSLNEELKEVPAEEMDIDSIGKSFEPTVPDFAKIEPPKNSPEDVAEMKKIVSDLTALYEDSKKMVPPECMEIAQEAVDTAFEEFEKVHGIHPDKILEKLKERAEKGQRRGFEIDENSPIFKVADDLKAKLQSVRAETLDTIHAVIPPKVPAHEEKMKDDALYAVYRWIVSPDEVNSKKAIEIGNECPDKPAGLLALCAFWAGGNLLPEGEQVVPTPPGLLANGLCQVLLMCALHKGGTRKLKERYEHYFNLGVDVLTAKNLWDESVILGETPKAPEFSEQENVAIQEEKEEDNQEEKSEEIEEIPEKKKYQRWKPQEPCVDLTKKKGFLK